MAQKSKITLTNNGNILEEKYLLTSAKNVVKVLGITFLSMVNLILFPKVKKPIRL